MKLVFESHSCTRMKSIVIVLSILLCELFGALGSTLSVSNASVNLTNGVLTFSCVNVTTVVDPSLVELARTDDDQVVIHAGETGVSVELVQENGLVQVTFTEAQRYAIGAITQVTGLKLNSYAGAYFALEQNTTNVEELDVAVTVEPDVSAPVAVSATVNLLTGKIAITFNEYVDYSTAIASKLMLTLNGQNMMVSDEATVDNQESANETIYITMTEEDRSTMTGRDHTSYALTLTINTAFVKGPTSIGNVQQVLNNVPKVQDTVGPELLSVSTTIIDGRMEIIGSEVLDGASFNPSLIVVDQSVGLDGSTIIPFGLYNTSLAFTIPSDVMVELLPRLHDGVTVSVTILPGAIHDRYGNGNSQVFELELTPDATLFETKIFSVNINTAVRGQTKSIQFIGTGLSSGQVAKWVNVDCSEAGVSLSALDIHVSNDELSTVTSASNQAGTISESTEVTFLTASSQTGTFKLCYENVLYVSHTIVVYGIDGVTQNIGADDFIVSDSPKIQTFQGFGVNEGDHVKWVEQDVDCNQPVTHHASELTVSSSSKVTLSVARTDGGDLAGRLYLCYQFGGEAYQKFSEFILNIGHVSSMTSTDILVATQDKTVSFSGVSVSMSLDQIVFIESTHAVNDLSCDDAEIYLPLEPSPIVSNFGSTPLHITDAPLPPRDYRLCYKFRSEPFKLYDAIRLTVGQVIAYNVSQGVSTLAVKNHPKTFYLHGSGFQVGVDRIRWTPDPTNSSACTSFPNEVISINENTNYNTAIVSMSFSGSAGMVYMCHGFGTSEPYQVYDFIAVQVRTVDTMTVNRTVEGLQEPDYVRFSGLGLSVGDRIKFTEPDSNVPLDEWCDDTLHNLNRTETHYIMSVTDGAGYPVPFPVPSREDAPFVLCYAHGPEPFHVYSTLTVEVDGLVSVSSNEFVNGLPTTIAFQGVGTSPGDIVRWVVPSDLNVTVTGEVRDADCWNQHDNITILYEQTMEDPQDHEVNFPVTSAHEEQYFHLCYLFANDGRYKVYNSEDFKTKVLGIRSVSLQHAVTNKTYEGEEISIHGTGLRSGDRIKWVDSRFVSSNENCLSAPSITNNFDGEQIVQDGHIEPFQFQTPVDRAAICYQFQNYESFRLYKDEVNVMVNNIQSISPRHALQDTEQSFLLQVGEVKTGDKVKLVWRKDECTVNSTMKGIPVSIVSCTKTSDNIRGTCAQVTTSIAGNKEVEDDAKQLLYVCYKFVGETDYVLYEELTVELVEPRIVSQSSNFYVKGVAKQIELTGAFGISSRDRFRFVPQEAESCDYDLGLIPEKYVTSTTLNSEGDPLGGKSILEIQYDALPDTSSMKLCYRFGTRPAIMFKEYTLSGQDVTVVELLTPLEQAVAGDPITFRFQGIGISDGDKVKWVSKPVNDNDAKDPAVCEGPMVGGSSEAIVDDELEARFVFNAAISDMLLCYKFNTEPYQSFPTLKIQQGVNVQKLLQQSSSSASTVLDDTVAAENEVTLLMEQEEQESKMHNEATVEISLDMNIATIPTGSVEEEQFKQDFIQDISQLLHIPEDRISIQTITSGSVIVNFVILPPLNHTQDQYPSESAASYLVEKVLDLNSDLYSTSRVLNKVNYDRPIQVVVLPNEDALTRANETASAQLQEQQGELEIIDFQQHGLFSFKEVVKIVVEDFDDSVKLVIKRDHGTKGTIPIHYTTRDGTATSPEYYSAVEGTIRFQPGVKEETIEIPIHTNHEKGAHFTWFMVQLSLIGDDGVPGARIGSKANAIVKIYDYGDGEPFQRSSFGVVTGTSNNTQGWEITGNRATDKGWVDFHGLYGVDHLYAENEYDERCDLSSPAEPCTYSCEYGGSYTETKGKDSGVLELVDGTGYVASVSPWEGKLNREFTITMWVKSEDRSKPGTLLSYHVEGTPMSEIILHDHRDLALVLKGRITDRRFMGIRTGVDLADGKWHFLAVTWNSAGGEVFVYKDGLLVFEGGPYRADASIKSGGSFVIGQTQKGLEPCFGTTATCEFEANRGFQGQIQNVRIWDKARTQRNIQDGMKWPFTSYQGNLRLYWRFVVDKNRPNAVQNIALSGMEHDGVLSTHNQSTIRIGDGAPSNHPYYPCGEVHSNMFYFNAPQQFLGDLRGLYNGRIQYRLFSPSQRGSLRNTRGSIRLIHGLDPDNDEEYMEISHGLIGFPVSDMETGWRGFSAVLSEDHGWIKEPSGKKLTFAEFIKVLSNVTAFQIRGDLTVYSTDGSGQETTYLNDVTIIRP